MNNPIKNNPFKSSTTSNNQAPVQPQSATPITIDAPGTSKPAPAQSNSIKTLPNRIGAQMLLAGNSCKSFLQSAVKAIETATKLGLAKVSASAQAVSTSAKKVGNKISASRLGAQVLVARTACATFLQQVLKAIDSAAKIVVGKASAGAQAVKTYAAGLSYPDFLSKKGSSKTTSDTSSTSDAEGTQEKTAELI
ncbi:hypothetical protein Q3G72_031905 [Acer saccharum]|nr:hypothetical protein Q3G72_031905 [Acer saccharum]